MTKRYRPTVEEDVVQLDLYGGVDSLLNTLNELIKHYDVSTLSLDTRENYGDKELWVIYQRPMTDKELRAKEEKISYWEKNQYERLRAKYGKEVNDR